MNVTGEPRLSRPGFPLNRTLDIALAGLLVLGALVALPIAIAVAWIVHGLSASTESGTEDCGE
jgi:hypothetical protein